MKSLRPWRSLVVSPGTDLASAGLSAAVALCVCAASAGAWWFAYRSSVARAAEEATLKRAALAQTLVATMESELSAAVPEAEGGLSRVRRLLADAAVLHGLSACTLEVPGAGVLADADPRRITLRQVPEQWPAGHEGGETAVPGLAETHPVRIGTRGLARLVIAGTPASGQAHADAALGAGACAVAGAGAGLWLIGRHGRRQRGLRVLSEAVHAATRGDAQPEAIEIDPAHGTFAEAWNALVRERAALRTQRTLASIVERASTAAPRDADLASACEAMWAGLVLVDDAGNIRYVNGAASAFLGAKREELVGKPVRDLLTEPEVVAALEAIAQGKGRGRVVAEIKRRGNGGPKLADEASDRRGQPAWTGGVLRVSIRPIRRADTGTAMLVIEDVTQQRVADESRNSFVAQATHELRTPLTNIRLYIEQLTDDEHLDAQARGKAINVVSQEARRLERIVADMLSVSEIEAGSLKLRTGDVRLAELLKQLADDYKPQAAAKEILLTFDLSPKLPVLSGDRDKIVLAIHNLLGNAIKYTPAGGAVSLRADTGPDERSAVIVVSDNGIGIRPDECEKVFEKFYRAQDRRIAGITGSGLGLALAREVARMHGGDITLDSQIDKGSTFTLTLPVGGAGAASVARPAAQAA